jgi:hypothetical protein
MFLIRLADGTSDTTDADGADSGVDGDAGGDDTSGLCSFLSNTLSTYHRNTSDGTDVPADSEVDGDTDTTGMFCWFR